MVATAQVQVGHPGMVSQWLFMMAWFRYIRAVLAMGEASASAPGQWFSKLGSLDQQRQHQLGTRRCRFSGSIPDLLNQE